MAQTEPAVSGLPTELRQPDLLPPEIAESEISNSEIAESEIAESKIAGPLPSQVAVQTDIPRELSQTELQDLNRRITESIDRGIDFMLENQNPDGSWGLPTRTKSLNIYAPVPGAHHAFRTAVTAMGISALCEQESRRSDVTAAIEAAQVWMLENLTRLRRATPDAIYNVWGHGYAISALVCLHERSDDSALKSRLVELIETQFQRLSDYESLDGGWGYYDFNVGSKRPTSSSTSFVNATVLVAMHHARRISVQPPEELVERAVAATLRQQKPDFTYLYGEYMRFQPMRGINRPGGSLGRSQACNIALRYWDDPQITDEVLVEWLQRLIDRHGWLDMGRKRPIPHEAWMQIAGYFFYYGHYYAALCLEELPEQQQRLLAPPLAELLIDRQESDGSWWDFPFYNYHPPYGTAFALMTIDRYRKATQEDSLISQAQSKFGAISAATPESIQRPIVELGQHLFWDERLSASGQIACASCHAARAWGADAERFSIDAKGQPTKRNSQTVFNSLLQSGLRWTADRRSGAHQAERSLTGSMGFSKAEDITGLLKELGYETKFQTAFPDDPSPISPANYAQAIQAYEETLTTPSPFDRFLGGDKEALSSQQREGLELFIEIGCADCHNGKVLGGESLEKFGVYHNYWTETESEERDAGLYEATGQEQDRYHFRVSMLRNIEKTAPYFHDGSVANLGEAVRIMAKLQLDRQLESSQIESIVAFLRSLTGDVPSNYRKPADKP